MSFLHNFLQPTDNVKYSNVLKVWFIQIGLFVTSGQILRGEDLLDYWILKKTMEAIIEKANRILPFGLKAQKLVPFFIAIKLVSFLGFAIFMMNR